GGLAGEKRNYEGHQADRDRSCGCTRADGNRGVGRVCDRTAGTRPLHQSQTKLRGKVNFMLTELPKVKVGALIAVLAGAAMLASAGSAMATLVKSDSISFKGTYNENGEWHTANC